MKPKKKSGQAVIKATKSPVIGYSSVLKNILEIINDARRYSAKSINAVMTATYWEIGRRIVELEQAGKKRAEYGKGLINKLSADLTTKFRRGFGVDNLQRMRLFYTYFQGDLIYATLSRKSILNIQDAVKYFPLPWSAYVALLSVKNDSARKFYEDETLRCGWSIRQLNRQINSMFYERTALSRNKAKMLQEGAIALKEDIVSPEEEIKDPCVLEFLSLKDEYSEGALEEALVLHLEKFLLELGEDFAFISRQKRLRIGDKWYRVDLLFFHRRLKCLVVVDLKVGEFTHADAGQMHMYLNYAKEHWTNTGENPPVGLILCAQKNESLAKYALKDLPNKVMTAEYKTVLPDVRLLAGELKKTQKMLEGRKSLEEKED
ncbi:DUF1016 family protein [bacterium]|nr:DUF1016 domain-containing protein [bacterium]MBU2529060.1 DUF1016 family protein [bacterium]